MSITKRVSDMEAELTSLRTRVLSDERTVALMKRQNEQQADEIERLIREHEIEVRDLKQQRDVAVRKATEVSGILDAVASGIVSGLRRMRGDETPAVIPDTPKRNPVSITDGMQTAATAADSVFELMPSRKNIPPVSFQ